VCKVKEKTRRVKDTGVSCNFNCSI